MLSSISRQLFKYRCLLVRPNRVIAYIDGFNLYYGILDAGLHTSRWLDLHGMCTALLYPQQQLELVRYFTSKVSNIKGAADRQAVLIDALEALGGLEIDFGYFLPSRSTCSNCGTKLSRREKKTDVQIAVRLLEDAYDDRFDTAMVVSGDSDLVPPIESVRERFPHKRVVVASPPKRRSKHLERVAESVYISPRTIRQNRLPDPVITSTGVRLWAPSGWLPSGTGDAPRD